MFANIFAAEEASPSTATAEVNTKRSFKKYIFLFKIKYMFIETLCIENRMVKNQTYHRKRMIETLEMHGYSVPEFPDVVAGIPLEFHS